MDFRDWLQERFGRFLDAEDGFLSVVGTAPGGGGGDLGSDTGGFTVSVSSQDLIVAPAPIWVDMSNPTGFEDEDANPISEPADPAAWDPTFHKITWITIVERRTSTSPDVWTQMTGAYPRVVNMVTAWNQAYVGYGKRVAFRLPDPGVYRFRTWAVDMQGNTGLVTSSTVTVLNPDVAFSAANTIIYAGDGDFTGAPAGSTQVSTMAALNTAIGSRSAPTRIRFKPGETVTGELRIDTPTDRAEYCDTWVPGEKVFRRETLQRTTSFMYYFNDEAVQTQTTWVDHTFIADWDETTETGDSGNGPIWETRFITTAMKCMVYNCNFTGIKLGWLSFVNDLVDRRWMIADCFVTNWKNYGFYCERNGGGRYTFLGTTIARQHDALSGGFPLAKQELRNDHGSVRFADCYAFYAACCDFFNLAGWSGGGPGGLPAANATVRMFHFSSSNPQSAIVDRCVAEGGYITWKMDGQDDTAVEYPGNYLFDKVLTICSARTIFPWSTAMGGATRRNCYTWAPNIPYYDSPGGIRHEVAYERDGTSTPASNVTFPMLNYCNTFLGLGDDTAVPATDGFESGWGALYVRENYINHQPNAGVPVTAFGPLNTDPLVENVPGVTPRTSGVRWNYRIIVLTGVSVPNGGTLSIPYSSIDSSNGAGHGDTTPTNQAYWQALPGSDNQHAVKPENVGEPYLAARGELSVSYADATNIVITNSSGASWTGTVRVHLDRKSRLATDIPPLTQYASPTTIPMPRPQAGSSALNALSAGELRPHDSFDAPGVAGVARTRTDAGAVEAV